MVLKRFCDWCTAELSGDNLVAADFRYINGQSAHMDLCFYCADGFLTKKPARVKDEATVVAAVAGGSEAYEGG